MSGVDTVAAPPVENVSTATIVNNEISNIVVCDGSVYDPSKPYLFITLSNHTVHALKDQTEELGFDATCNRMISTLSLHDRCGVIVSSKKHMSLLQNLGYPVVLWGQTVAFPMDRKSIKKMGVGAYPGAVTVHTFTEPLASHNKIHTKDGKISGDGKFDGLNHLAGAYVPLALALSCATTGKTAVNLTTSHSGLMLQEHSIALCVDGNFTSLCFQDNTAGSIAVDGQVTHCTNAVNDTIPLVVGSKQLIPGFDNLIQEMSNGKESFMKKLVDNVGVNIGNGVFAKYDKKLESDIRTFASKRTELCTKGVSDGMGAGATGTTIDLCDLSETLQKSFCTSNMVGMSQPTPIGAPTVVVPDATNTSHAADATAAAHSSDADKYGDRFSTLSYALEPHHQALVGQSIHKFFGVVTVSHALFLSQISAKQAYDICAPFADPDSAFLDCKNPSCECNTKMVTRPPIHTAEHVLPTTTSCVSDKFERMLRGVSQNIALSNTPSTGLRVPTQIPKVLSTKPRPNTECTVTNSGSCDTCTCTECVRCAKLLHLTQQIASCTHAYQKCDNYIPDQAMVAVTHEGVPQYKSTESMHPFGTALKAVMVASKCGADETDDIKLRVGMNSDDCENSAFQTKAILDTLHVGSQCISADYFHGAKDPATYNRAADEETLRCMRLGNLTKQEQRHILLTCEVIGKVVEPHLGYFVTGSPAATSNLTSTKTNAIRGTRNTDNVSTMCIPDITSITLPATVGGGLNAFGSKQPGQRVSYKTTTADGVVSGGLSGHCTCTLSITRKDGSLHTVVVEGTAHVKMGKGTDKIKVWHRGLLSSSIDDDTKKTGEGGHFNGPSSLENAVDVTMDARISSHILTISTRMQVPGSNMRASVFMGTDVDTKNNCSAFYDNVVSSGQYQFVQLDANKRIQPGADVKIMLKQGAIPVFDMEEVGAGGEEVLLKKMGNATVAMVRVFDPNAKDAMAYQVAAQLFGRAVSSLKLSPEMQDTHMLSTMGSLSSLKANFPEDTALKTRYKNMSTFTSHVTHVAIDDTVEGRAKVLKSMHNHATQMNTDYVNVRVANPVVMPSGEIVTLFRIYNVPPDKILG